MGAEGRVVIVPYDPAWPQHYVRERDAITTALGDLLVAIAHVGSTAVPGLAAKPVIDLMPGVAAEAAWTQEAQPHAHPPVEHSSGITFQPLRYSRGYQRS